MGIAGLAFWGFTGAFVYAAPRLLISITAQRVWFSLADCAVALLIGPIGAAGFAEFIGNTLHQTTNPELRAIAVVLGMISNPVAPAIVHLMGTGVIRRLGGTSMKARHHA